MVVKQDGSWRPCSDYRSFNSMMVPDTNPIPSMLDFAARAAHCTHFSKIDLKKRYHLVPMNATDIPKMVITMPFSLFKFTCMAFGIQNMGNTFQQLINRTLAGMKSSSPYMDDILVFSKGNANLCHHLQETLEPLRAAGLTANAEKCEFKKQSIEFLGHTKSAAGIVPLLTEWQPSPSTPAPTTSRSCRTSWG